MGLLTAAERERRRLAVIEGLAAGQSMAEIAAGLDVDRYTMVRWARRNDLTAPVRTPPKPQLTRTEAGRVERIATVKAAAAAGLTQAQVARDLGMTRDALGKWLSRHMPDHGLRSGNATAPEETERRARAVREGLTAGLSVHAIADQLGMNRRTLACWIARNADDGQVYIEDALWLRVTSTGRGWQVDCGPCGRRFTRPERRRAEWLAAMHARKHGLTIAARDRTGTRYEATDAAVA